jgi:hypothetical protein
MKKSLLTERHSTLLFAGAGLVALSALFLWIEHLTHVTFLAHMAAIPLEILVGAIVVERWLASRERDTRRRQFMYMKSYIFRSELRTVFISNFAGLVQPQISLEWIRTASPQEMRAVRDAITELRYKSPAVVDGILAEYVRSRHVFLTFLDWAATNDFEPIFHDMIFILHFIQDVDTFKQRNPDRVFADEAARFPRLQAKVDKILRDGVVKFLDYAIELREHEPLVFEELLEDYAQSARVRE